MPSLNQGRYIAEALESVFSQEDARVEVIVIDGGSTDDTVTTLSQYGKRIKYWCSEKDSGQSEAINKGIEHASGEVITWLNSDDRYRPHTLSTVSRLFMEKPETALLYGRANLFRTGKKGRAIGPAAPLQPHEHLAYMRFPQPASFFSAEALRMALPVNTDLHFAMDFELVCKVILRSGSLLHIPDVLADYRLHKDAKTNQEGEFMKEWTRVVLNVFDSLKGGDRFAAKLAALKLDQRTVITTYPCLCTFSERELQLIYLEHLHLLFHYYYRQGNRQMCEILNRAICEEDNSYAAGKALGRYMRRVTLLRPLLNIKRTLWG